MKTGQGQGSGLYVDELVVSVAEREVNEHVVTGHDGHRELDGLVRLDGVVVGTEQYAADRLLDGHDPAVERQSYRRREPDRVLACDIVYRNYLTLRLL